MKWLLYISIAVAALIVVIVIIGYALPVAHHATRIARFGQPPEVIFAAITGPQDWRPGVTIEQMSSADGVRRWRETSGRQTITFEETVREAPRLYRTRIADKNLPFAGTWTYEITPTADGCTLRITEDGQVFNPIFRFVGRFIIGNTKTIEDYLRAMGKKFGEEVKIEE